MKKFFITLVCASLAISVFAGVSRLSRSELKNTTVIAGHVSNVTPASSTGSAQSLQQFMRERQLGVSGKSFSRELSFGAKIASVDAYNFEWDNETGTAQIDESACAMMGRYCTLTSSSSSSGNVNLSYFYGDFAIPCNIDFTTRVLTIKTCEPLNRMDSLSYFDPNSSVYKSPMSPSLKTKGHTYWTLYAVPLSWLMGDDNCEEYIYGQVNDHGTITFYDDFAFVVETSSDGEVSWSLSPIFKNLTLLTPNGTHEFDYTRLSADAYIYEEGLGCGGLVPRPHKPGSSKPISAGPGSPRPIAPRPDIDGGIGSISGSNQIVETVSDAHLLQIEKLTGTSFEPDGHVGLVTKKTGRSQPTVTTHELQPVYMYWTDATTLMVYNLFGMGTHCHLTVNKDAGTVQIAQQQIYNDGLGRVLDNRSCSGIWSQDSATWDCTETMISSTFKSNVLQFLGDSTPFTEPPMPGFDEPIVTDTTVIFCATTDVPGMVVKLYRYVLHEEEGFEEVLEVDNPLTVPRLTQPYWIDLVAETYNPVTGVHSDTEWFWYEVPALETGISGDVNGDGVVTGTDVTILYNYLLNNDDSDMINGDQNTDGFITAADITIIYNILLGE